METMFYHYKLVLWRISYISLFSYYICIHIAFKLIAQIFKQTDFRFELNKAQSIDGIPSDVIRGCKFKVDPIEPLVFETDGGPEETTGTVDLTL